jgi:F0F1-type ATP synthase delta subunit
MISRRRLAQFAVNQLSAGKPADQVSKLLAAELVATKRAGQAELLLSDIAAEFERRGKLSTATVTSAHGISDHLKNEIRKFIKSALAVDEVAIEESVDPSVIGGVRIDSASKSWDRTILKELSDIREAF